jgi:hypothetical protein
MTVEEEIRNYEIEPITYGSNKGKIIVRNPPKDATEKADCAKHYKKALGNEICVKGLVDNNALWYFLNLPKFLIKYCIFFSRVLYLLSE